MEFSALLPPLCTVPCSFLSGFLCPVFQKETNLTEKKQLANPKVDTQPRTGNHAQVEV